MYPLLRTAHVLWRARSREPLQLDGDSRLQLRAWLSDIDPFLELNNARYLSMMELGRWDYAVRVGFYTLMRERKWGVVVGGASIRYRRRIPAYNRFELSTRMACHDQRWFYFVQEFYRNDQICASALIKAGVNSRDGLIPATEVGELMGHPDWGHEVPDWIQAWIDAEGMRPWPGSADLNR